MSSSYSFLWLFVSSILVAKSGKLDALLLNVESLRYPIDCVSCLKFLAILSSVLEDVDKHL
jgi:hypothetical protein